MTEVERKKLSKKMSYALRHAPEKFGLTLENYGGWVSVFALAEALHVTVDEITTVATTPSDKVRFTLDNTRIRAAQGHSISVELGYVPVEPPDMLFHGTGTKALTTIFEDGLKPMARTHVHLSGDIETALRVGSRKGRPVILQVAALRAHVEGVKFYRADNGVWLANAVPAKYLTATLPAK